MWHGHRRSLPVHSYHAVVGFVDTVPGTCSLFQSEVRWKIATYNRKSSGWTTIFSARFYSGTADAQPLNHDHNRYRRLCDSSADGCLRVARRGASSATKTKHARYLGGVASATEKSCSPDGFHTVQSARRHGSFGLRSISQQA